MARILTEPTGLSRFQLLILKSLSDEGLVLGGNRCNPGAAGVGRELAGMGISNRLPLP
jgi:hypothetical protein